MVSCNAGLMSSGVMNRKGTCNTRSLHCLRVFGPRGRGSLQSDVWVEFGMNWRLSIDCEEIALRTVCFRFGSYMSRLFKHH